MKRLTLTIITTAAMLAADGRDIATATSGRDFEKRREAVGDTACFAIFSRDLTPDQRQALEFLYAYMPLPDITDHPGEYYLENVDLALRAAAEMPWGKSVPDREWRHFVLPPRVNNERLDTCRRVFYEELKPRVAGLSMADAILEVNRWCHEKATYRPSDSRTRSPLQTVKGAIGRCGEESTFAVAALRSVGIPARQIYTPRWAHTDDNHAWVEAWADGRWHFLGACEPEPVLDLGWFNAPASRGVMMNTRAFGAYDGPEQQLDRSDCHTTINVTANYAPVSDLTVTVAGADGRPAEGAEVRFCVYNYAEYYPITVMKTGSDGRATLTAGRGDLVIEVTDGTRAGFARATVGKDRAITVVPTVGPGSAATFEWTLTPPPPSANIPDVPAALAEKCRLLSQREDSVRGAYTATFVSDATPVDDARLKRLLILSRGNHQTIKTFVDGAADRGRALDLLEALSEKDLGDVTREVLDDHMATRPSASPLYNRYIMNPRIGNETLTPYKKAFAGLCGSIGDVIRLVADSVAVEPRFNPQQLIMDPVSALRLGKTDARSREVLLVALARSNGIAARIDPVTGKTQYSADGATWTDISPSRPADTAQTPRGRLRLAFEPSGHLTDPVYYTHFTLSKINGGVPSLLEYDEGATWSGLFRDGADIDAGQYLLTTGQRLADGSVLARSEIFTVGDGGEKCVTLTVRQDTTQVQVVGSFDSESVYRDAATGRDMSLLARAGRGYYALAFLKPDHEPSNHALSDIAASAAALGKWGRTLFLIFADESSLARVDRRLLDAMPPNVVTGTDPTGAIAAGLQSDNLPAVIIADTFNRVVLRCDGYTINLGERLASTAAKLGE